MAERLHRFQNTRSIQGPIVVLMAGFVLAAMAVSASASPALTKGPIPDKAFLQGGEIDPGLVPDYVPVWGRDGITIAGYVTKAYVLNPIEASITSGPFTVPDQPVLGEDLKTLVGYMVAGKGFVPLGVNPATIPQFPVELSSE